MTSGLFPTEQHPVLCFHNTSTSAPRNALTLLMFSCSLALQSKTTYVQCKAALIKVHCAAHPHPFLLPALAAQVRHEKSTALTQEAAGSHLGHSDNRANVCLSLFINSVCSKLYNYENNKTTAGSPGIFTISPCCSEVSLCCCTDWLCLVPQDV